MVKKVGGILIVAAAATVLLAPGASATIHPIVESFDCAADPAFENHPLGDPADPPGQTPGENGSPQSDLRAIIVITDGFSDFSSPALFGHKLNDECGTAAGQ